MVKKTKSKRGPNHSRKNKPVKSRKRQSILLRSSQSVILSKNKPNRRRTLKKHLQEMQKLGQSKTNRIRITRFLNYLTNLGKEKGEIDMDLFTKGIHNEKILKFIIKRYGGQCGESIHVNLRISNMVNEEGKIIGSMIIGVKELSKCLDDFRSKKSKHLIIHFSSANKTDPYGSGHINLLVINTDKKEMLRIDPIGENPMDDNYYFKEGGAHLANYINNAFGLVDESEKYKYINNVSMICPNVNPQEILGELNFIRDFVTKKEMRPTELETGTCFLWTTLFSELIVGFPELSYVEVLQHLSGYIQKEAETALYLIRGYFWYLRREIFSDMEEQKKEENGDVIENIESLTKQHTRYLSDLQEEKENYSPLIFKRMYDSVQKTINHIKKMSLMVGVPVKRELSHSLSIYETLEKRYQEIKSLIDSKRSDDVKNLEEELLFIIDSSSFSEKSERYGVDDDIGDGIVNFTKVKASLNALAQKIYEVEDDATSLEYKEFYETAKTAINDALVYTDRHLEMEAGE
jgi:hypothetical protein